MRKAVTQDLARITDDAEREKRLELLASALRDKSSDVRRQALLSLADVHGREKADEILAMLSDVEIRVRQMAVLALGEVAEPGDQQILGRIASLLRAGDPSIRYQALLAHCQLLPEEAAGDIERALGDEDPEIRELAVRLVDESLMGHELPVPKSLGAKVVQACADAEERVRLVAQLVAAENEWSAPLDLLVKVVDRRLRAREPRDEQLAVQLAGRLGLNEAQAGLRRRAFGVLGMSMDPFRWVALGALARMGDDRALDKLKKALGSRHFSERTMATQGLGESRHPTVKALLSPMVGEEQLVDQKVLSEALSNLGV